MGRRLRAVAAMALALSLTATASAHHSPAVFDLRTEVTLTGVITAYQFRNPHLFVHMEVADGAFAGAWEVEAQSPRIMSLYGWTPKSLSPGERVVVVANPPQQRAKRLALGLSVQKSDGTTLRIPWNRREIREALRAGQKPER